MRTKHITTKTTPIALQMLRLIAEHTGEKQYRVLERVLRQELVKLQQAPAALVIERVVPKEE